MNTDDVIPTADYLDYSGCDDVLSGGIKLIPIETPKGTFRVWMAGTVQRGRYLFCPNGSHMAMYDDQETYFRGLIRFIRDVDAGRFR